MINATDPLSKIDFNQKFAHAFDRLENSLDNIFITGKAGTGKSTLLEYFRLHSTKKLVCLAPTGVAAVRIKGQTIHSFFRFRPDITVEGIDSIRMRRSQRQLYEKLDILIIDEVSMVRADLMDCIDVFLQKFGPNKGESFGGVQLVFFGDLYQLPPVVTPHERELFRDVYVSPYFFDAKCFNELDLQFIELDKIYRQKEEDFIKLLGSVRNKTISDLELKELNARYQPHFKSTYDDFYLSLTTTNALADQVNQQYLKQLKTDSYFHEGILAGDFEGKGLPTQSTLEVKEGAQVMMLNNDPSGRWVNGSIGKITFLGDPEIESDIIEVQLTDGNIVDVMPFTWEMYQFFYNDETESVESEPVGSFTQYPLKLAWAVTIHKSQGQTFDKVIVDIGNGTFAHGQTYVALSRCTSFEGIILRKPILKRHILVDDRISSFMNKYQCS